VPLDGGKVERLVEIPDYGPIDISPDGKLAAFGATGTAKKRLALVPVDSPQNAKLVDLQRSVPWYEAIRFTHDGKGVVYALADQDSANLWLQPLDGSPESRSPTSSRNRSSTFTGRPTAASWV
jgi:Tol biopolymer transport system component